MRYEFLWDDDPAEGNVAHLAEHDLTPQDVEHAFAHVLRETTSRSSDRPALFGLTPDDRVVFVVYEEIDEGLIYVFTAYEVEVRTMRPVTKQSGQVRSRKRAAMSPAKLRALRTKAKEVRQQVACDRDQIAAEAREAVANAVARGTLTKLTVLLRPDEKPVLDALDRYASEHGLKSRNQVLRAALAQLLGIEMDQPHWGWPSGKPRT